MFILNLPVTHNKHRKKRRRGVQDMNREDN